MALRSILLKITGDPSEAKRALTETATALKTLDGTTASASVVLKNQAEVRKQIEVLKERLASLAHEKPSPEVDLQTKIATAELGRLEGKLADLDGQAVEVKATLQETAIKLQIDAVKARLERLSAQEATPKVQIHMGRAVEQIERLEVKLAKLDGKDVTVDVNVDNKGGISGIAGIGPAIAGAAGSLVSLASAATAGIPAVSRLIASLASIGPAALIGVGVLLPLMASLISSFAAAAAGAAVLGVALAGALGPVVLVAVAAVTKLVSAFKAVKEHSDGAKSAAKQQASAAASIASAQDGVRSATEGLARAQSNLRQATTDAYRAWQDSIEAVKDDLLSVEHAQLGIEDANLSLREAQLALKQFRAEAGLAGDAFGSIFEKFTDVSVDTSGLQEAIANAAKGSGRDISEDDQLKLERLILRVREAKLGEKDATDQLHDANTKLARDRSTAADFAKQGIAAFGPYKQAVEGVTAAQRALIASNRQLAQAQATAAAIPPPPPAPTGPVADLIAAIGRAKDAAVEAFGPALIEVFKGATEGVKEFTKAFDDPRIQKSLTGIGKALGGVFSTFGKLFANKEFRDGFVKMAEGGARLVTVIGSRIFTDFLTLMLRLATAALPDLLELFEKLADKFHVFVEGTRDGEELRKKVKGLIEETRRWVRALLTIGGIIVDVTNFFSDLASEFKKQIGEMIDADKELIDDIKRAWRNVKNAISGFASDAVQAVKDKFTALPEFFESLGRRAGKAFGKALKAAFSGIGGLGRAIGNALIDAINYAARKINDFLPDKINIKGAPDINLPDDPIPTIPRLAAGGVALRSVLANIGEAGKEAVIPLTHSVLSQLGLAISAATPALRVGAIQPAMAGAGSYGTHIENFHANVTAPRGELPDAQSTATALTRLIERRTAGSLED